MKTEQNDTMNLTNHPSESFHNPHLSTGLIELTNHPTPNESQNEADDFNYFIPTKRELFHHVLVEPSRYELTTPDMNYFIKMMQTE